MQIFLPYHDVISSALTLLWHDKRRFNKQIIECKQILHAIDGLKKGEKRPWQHHPIVLMYKDHEDFLRMYLNIFLVLQNDPKDSKNYAYYTQTKLDERYPDFLDTIESEWYFKNFRSRLYTKDPVKYEHFKEDGNSYSNFYYVNGEWKEYKQ